MPPAEAHAATERERVRVDQLRPLLVVEQQCEASEAAIGVRLDAELHVERAVRKGAEVEPLDAARVRELGDARLARSGLARDLGDVDPAGGDRLANRAREVLVHDCAGRPVRRQAPVLDHESPAAEAADSAHVVAHEEDRPPVARDVVHLAEALRLELGVADREHLVDEHDLGLQVRGDGEGEPHLHPRRVPLHGSVEEAPHAGELDDLVESAGDLPPLHSEDDPVEIHVLAPRQLGMEARADLEQGAHAAANPSRALRRAGDPGEDLQERALSCPVASDDADCLTAADVERHVAQGPQVVGLRGGSPVPRRPESRGERTAQRLAEHAVGIDLAEPVPLAQPLDTDGGVARHYTASAKESSTRRK